MPEDSDSCLHRVGRAGRFGTKGYKWAGPDRSLSKQKIQISQKILKKCLSKLSKKCPKNSWQQKYTQNMQTEIVKKIHVKMKLSKKCTQQLSLKCCAEIACSIFWQFLAILSCAEIARSIFWHVFAIFGNFELCRNRP